MRAMAHYCTPSRFWERRPPPANHPVSSHLAGPHPTRCASIPTRWASIQSVQEVQEGGVRLCVPTWVAVGRRWGGQVELSGVVRPWSSRYPSSRILLMDQGSPVRWLTWTGPPPTGAQLARQFRDARVDGPQARTTLPSTTLIICSRDRPERLRRCLESVRNGFGPDVEVVVVDSAPRSEANRDVVRDAEANGLPVRRIIEPRPGLSRARNAGIDAADAEVVAFVDDDVLIEPGWLDPLRDELKNERIAVAVGLVPSAEVETVAQMAFERRIPWSSRLTPARLSLNTGPRPPAPFPYNAGQIGTGANMAIRRSVVTELRGFDTALGAGTWTKGGEDLEMFVRVLRAGWDIAYVPSSIVWHVHEMEMATLRSKVFGYGAGASAFLTSTMCRPGRRDVITSLAPLARFAVRRRRDQVRSQSEIHLQFLETLGLAWGPLAYAAERIRQRPLYDRGASTPDARRCRMI